ncbi:MAG: ATP-binding protein [Desulfuromonadaceae bacterium]|nr:ATP-binding protein [Desulfuromonadaceae bacterium]MDD5107234.1 ATP-binding protein [Desulfuromonadaceae bacterium]
MKVGVAHKLFLALLTAAVLSVFSAVVIMQWNISRGFLKFINSVEQSGVSRLTGKLEEFYRSEQKWDLLRSDPARWNRLIAVSMPQVGPPHGSNWPAPPPPEERMPDGPPPQHIPDENHGPMQPRISHDFEQRIFLLDGSKNVLINNAKVTVDTTVTPLLYQGRIIGYLGLSPRQIIADAPQQRFLREQKLALGLTAGVVVLLASALSLLLARRLVKPIQELTHATHQLAAGSFAVRVPVAAHDELGQLARDFNALAVTLEQGELTRRQWVADISHELRTPLSILRGEIEALQDGIRQPTTDTINSLHSEVMHLVRLVDDLYQLSLSDVGALTYRKSELDLASVLEGTVMPFRSDFLSKNISLELKIPENCGVSFFGDSERLHQLFSNLLDNSLKYTDSGGRLQVALHVDNSKITIDFNDSAPNVPETELGRLFERLYRVESSRNRLTGGAGLGLAICRNIVTAHNGNIMAQASSMGGLWIRIELPGASS